MKLITRNEKILNTELEDSILLKSPSLTSSQATRIFPGSITTLMNEESGISVTHDSRFFTKPMSAKNTTGHSSNLKSMSDSELPMSHNLMIIQSS